MSAKPALPVPVRCTPSRSAVLVSAAFLASSLLLSFPVDAGGSRGGGSAPSRGSSMGGGGRSVSGGSHGSSGGGRSYSAPSRGSSGGSRSYSAPSRGSSGGSRSYSAPSRSSSGGNGAYSAAPRSSSTGGRSWTSAKPLSSSTRSSHGDRPYTATDTRSGTPGTHTISAAGSRGGPGGGGGSGGGTPGGGPGGGSPGGGGPGGPGGGGDPGGGPPGGGGGHPGGGGGGHPGGGHPGGGHHGGGHGGWYCPPTYWAGTSWYWGGPWDWWLGWGSVPYWGWGSYWGWGPYWGGGVYVVQDGEPLANSYARVDTDVSPEGAEVFLDGTLIGQADDFDGFPDYLYLESGRYRLEFRHPYYETVSRDLEVRAGQAIAIDDQMKLLPGKKKLEVVDPEDHGTPLGRVFGNPEARKGEVAGERTGRFDVTVDPDAAAGPDDDLGAPPPVPPADAPPTGPDEDLAPAEKGRLRFEVVPGDAAVYLDDRYVGTGQELADLGRGLGARPGTHTITVVRPGYGTRTVEIVVKPGKTVDVVVELER